LEEISYELGSDGDAALFFSVLSGIAVIRDDSRDRFSRGALSGIYEEE
jgi:hypothetical protein